MKSFLLKYTPEKIFKFYQEPFQKKIKEQEKFANISYSQEGEDLILMRIFDSENSSGFFVDVGAHHPQRFSNTYLFYQMGWRGINIDATPGSMISFNKIRPEDINLEYPVSDEEKKMLFYIFNEPALNTFSREQAKKKDGYKNFKVVEEKKLISRRLDSLLDQFLPEDRRIDFLNVDVEGLDLQVLKSNNWKQYSPRIIVIETSIYPLKEILNTQIHSFLEEKNYELIAKTFNSLFFLNKNDKYLIERKLSE